VDGGGGELPVVAAARLHGEEDDELLDATFCLMHGHRLLHRDRDFYPFEKVLGCRWSRRLICHKWYVMRVAECLLRSIYAGFAQTLFVEGASSGGTGHVCETLDGLTARPVQVRLLPHGRQRAHSMGIRYLTWTRTRPTLVIVRRRVQKVKPRASRGAFDFVVSQKAHVSNTAKLGADVWMCWR